MRTKQSKNVDRALYYMLDLIDSDYEYADAEWKASTMYGVEPDDLRDAYDNMMMLEQL